MHSAKLPGAVRAMAAVATAKTLFGALSASRGFEHQVHT